MTTDLSDGCCKLQHPHRRLPRVRRNFYHEAFQAIYKQIDRVCEGKSSWPLTLGGPAGSGKTCAGLVMLDIFGGEYWTTAAWCERVAAAKCERLYEHGYKVYPQAVRERMEKANLVVLDELGLRPDPSQHEVDEVHYLIDKRYGLPLILISNYSPYDLGLRYGGQLTSRLEGGTVVEFPDVDYRARR